MGQSSLGGGGSHAQRPPYSQHFPWALGSPAALVVLGLDVALSPVLQRARHVALHHVGTVAPGGKNTGDTLTPCPADSSAITARHCQQGLGDRSWKYPPSLGSCWGGASQPCCRSVVPVTVTAMLSPVLVVSPELGCAWHSMDCVVRQAEDNQNPSSSCRNSIPELASAVPGRGDVSCCGSWSAASAGANPKAFSPCCGCCHRQGTERRCCCVGLQYRGSLHHGGRDRE